MKAPDESFCFSPVFNSPDFNFGTDQLRDMGKIQRWVSCVLTTDVQANLPAVSVAYGNIGHARMNICRISR